MFTEDRISMISRYDIRHKHHKQCLCKIISTVGKMSQSEQISSVISKIFVLLLIEVVFKVKNKVQILRELWCFVA